MVHRFYIWMTVLLAIATAIIAGCPAAPTASVALNDNASVDDALIGGNVGGLDDCPVSDSTFGLDDGPIGDNISAPLGEPIPSASADQLATFARGKLVLQRRFDLADGLGPTFNVVSCVACHERPVAGGSAALYRNFFLAGSMDANGVFVPAASAGLAGGVIRAFSYDVFVPARPPIPADATIFAQRNSIPMFGVGLIAQIPASDTQNFLTREFRYDSDRQRHLERDLDHATFVPAPTSTPQWHTHLGNAAWGDYGVAVDSSGFPVKTGVARYAFGLGLAQQTDSSGTRTFHADQIGTTRALTDGSGNVSSSLAFTAFGERLGSSSSVGTRYGYAGSFGYETDGLEASAEDIGVQHVGARYYDPAAGRFIQRDSVGVEGGPNGYVYAANLATISIDPDGETPFMFNIGMALGALYYNAVMGPSATVAAVSVMMAGVGGKVKDRVTKPLTKFCNRKLKNLKDDFLDWHRDNQRDLFQANGMVQAIYLLSGYSTGILVAALVDISGSTVTQAMGW